MLNNNNPYIVPQGYFASAKEDLLKSAAKIRARKIAVVSVISVLLILWIPLHYYNTRSTSRPDFYVEASDLLNHDIVLQILE